MSLFDVIKYPVSCPPTLEEMSVMPPQIRIFYFQYYYGKTWTDEYLQYVVQTWLMDYDGPGSNLAPMLYKYPVLAHKTKGSSLAK